MESSHGVELGIDFSPVKKRRYEQYSSELWTPNIVLYRDYIVLGYRDINSYYLVKVQRTIIFNLKCDYMFMILNLFPKT